MPRAATRREDAALIEFGSNATDAADTLSPQVLHYGLQVRCAMLSVGLHRRGRLLVANGKRSPATIITSRPFRDQAFVIVRACVVILVSSQNLTFDVQAVPYTAIVKYAIGEP